MKILTRYVLRQGLEHGEWFAPTFCSDLVVFRIDVCSILVKKELLISKKKIFYKHFRTFLCQIVLLKF